jgi:hypothetical protein
MTEPDLGDDPAVAWSINGARYEMQVHGDTAAFFHPDGQFVEMTKREWIILARAVGLLMGEHEPPNSSPSSDRSNKAKAARGGLRWTEDDDANLLHYWEAGETVDDLIARFDRSEGGVTSRLVRLRVAANREDILTESRRRRRAKAEEARRASQA